METCTKFLLMEVHKLVSIKINRWPESNFSLTVLWTRILLWSYFRWKADFTFSWSVPTYEPLQRFGDMDGRTSVDPVGILKGLHWSFPFFSSKAKLLRLSFVMPTLLLRCLKLGMSFNSMLLIVIKIFRIIPMVMH